MGGQGVFDSQGMEAEPPLQGPQFALVGLEQSDPGEVARPEGETLLGQRGFPDPPGSASNATVRALRRRNGKW